MTQQELQTTTDPYLDLIREVTGNPELSAEKLKILVDMRLLLEDREAAKLFKLAMSKARKEIKALAWDKKGDNNHYVSYPKIEKMLEPVREKYGFNQTFDTEVSAVAGQMIFCCDVEHDGGHTKRYRLPMSIDGQGPKGGGVMTGAQAVGNGTSYAMRYLQKMIWNISMLVDKDDTDGATPKELIDQKQQAELKTLADSISADCETGLLKYMGFRKLADIPAAQYEKAMRALKKKQSAGVSA